MRKIIKLCIGICVLLCSLFLLVGCNLGDEKVRTTEQFFEAVEHKKDRIILKKDLDFSGIEWTELSFNGHIEGNGHTIKNISIKTSEASYNNLGIFSGTRSIKNVNFENIQIKYYGDGKGGIGGLVGLVSGTEGIEIENVKISGSVYAPNATYVGGLVGKLADHISVIIKNTEINMTVTGLDGVGGAVGSVSGGSGYFEGVTNKGEIKALDSAAGGILGAAYKKVSFVNCKNKAPISALCKAGGIIGTGHVSEINACINEGTITCKMQEDIDAFAGGIGGEVKLYDTVSECTNKGATVANGFRVGGLFGHVLGEGKVVGCTNTGKVNGDEGVGGIAGVASGKIQLLNCKNKAEVNGGAGAVGGIIGIAMDNAFVSKCSNESDVSADDAIGGIIGYIEENYDGTVSYNTNKGNVTATKSAAGIIGEKADVSKIKGLDTNENYGKINGEKVEEIIN